MRRRVVGGLRIPPIRRHGRERVSAGVIRRGGRRAIGIDEPRHVVALVQGCRRGDPVGIDERRLPSVNVADELVRRARGVGDHGRAGTRRRIRVIERARAIPGHDIDEPSLGVVRVIRDHIRGIGHGGDRSRRRAGASVFKARGAAGVGLAGQECSGRIVILIGGRPTRRIGHGREASRRVEGERGHATELVRESA